MFAVLSSDYVASRVNNEVSGLFSKVSALSFVLARMRINYRCNFLIPMLICVQQFVVRFEGIPAWGQSFLFARSILFDEFASLPKRQSS